jgi:signal transduction histidine kinase
MKIREKNMTVPPNEKQFKSIIKALRTENQHLENELIEARNRFESLDLVFSYLSEVVIITDSRGKIVSANSAAGNLLNINPMDASLLVLARKFKIQTCNGRRISSKKFPLFRALQGEIIYGEQYLISGANGQKRYLIICSAPLTVKGAVVGAILIGRDESEKERLSRLLEQKQAALKAVISSASEGILIIDEKGRITMTNSMADQLLEHRIAALSKVSSLPFCNSDGSPGTVEDLPLTRSVLHGQIVSHREIGVRLPNGLVRQIFLSSAPILDSRGHIQGAVGIVQEYTMRIPKQDQLSTEQENLRGQVIVSSAKLGNMIKALQVQIQEREQIEKTLIQSQAELKQLSRRTLETLEADRQAVSKELHDSIGASLAAIKFGLEAKLAHMNRDSSSQTASIEDILSHLTKTIKETKHIAARLRPTILDDLGLLTTLDWYFREFKALFQHIQVHKQIDINEMDIPELYKIVIYRIAQEAMHNAARHGRAKLIRVSLSKKQSWIQLCIEDDGQGFNIKKHMNFNDPLSGHGVKNMRERAEICGGEFYLYSQKGIGTRVVVRLPFNALAAEAAIKNGEL